MVKKQIQVLPNRRRRFRGRAATIAIKKQGRIILNRRAANFFEDGKIERVILLFDDATNTLTIKGVHSHDEEHIIYYGGDKNLPAALSAKTALNAINYDFSENRTFVIDRFVPTQAAIEVVLPKKVFLKNPPPEETGLGLIAQLPR